MGLCWGSPSVADPSPPTTKTYTTGISSSFSKNVATSGSSTGTRSQFSEGATINWHETYPNGLVLEAPNLKVFSFADLKVATKNFKLDTLLGEGGFGRVFKGWVDEQTLAPSKAGTGMMVAIKKLNHESMQGFQEWQAEVNFLGKLCHPNLVRLLGYCWDDNELLLVYEFVPKGSLENHLFRSKNSTVKERKKKMLILIRVYLLLTKLGLFLCWIGNTNIEPLSWDRRLNIAIGAARGLTFLHASEKIIYRDFKSSNILLDENFNAKISDFGLAKLGPTGGNSHVTTRIMGSYGYVAPEYMATGHLYVKSDVYGFGVVLLEMLTGMRAMDTRRLSGQQNLVEWAKPCLSSKGKLKTIMDVRIKGQYSHKAAMEAAQLTLKCLEREPRSRPSMKEVLEALEQIEEMKEKPKQSKTTSSKHSSK